MILAGEITGVLALAAGGLLAGRTASHVLLPSVLVAAAVTLAVAGVSPGPRLWPRPGTRGRGARPATGRGSTAVRSPVGDRRDGVVPGARRRPSWWPASWSSRRDREVGRGTESESQALLAFLDVLAPSLRAGRSPEEAARLACRVVRGGVVVEDIRDALAHGRSVETVLDRHARTHADVRLFARAWELSALTGCPLADTVSCVARLVRAKLAHRRRVETASTGARASIRILTLLPLGGPVLATAVGVDPVTAYVTSPTAWACLAGGAVLVLLGRRWVERLVADVARGPVVGPAR
ncbi:type II secretion system F family protein [Mobilicoccus pelagius]|uniref:Type II secretion system protein GspF domain-containing protein n=1 Tax=Mobilicoccus pelagius NBRC 104925 TaxID=1089455 RepID=H5UNW4_9MICO|nr:type II secretion system F family protein [Mobilicoccus pelagius]GAB47422.1 hypothetical protein MOPEL_011_00040 [Mobilicoccus pelagius NBRC 104925]